MIQVVTKRPMDENWKTREALILSAAGRMATFAGADSRERDHGWKVASMEEATAMKERLETVQGVEVTIEET